MVGSIAFSCNEEHSIRRYNPEYGTACTALVRLRAERAAAHLTSDQQTNNALAVQPHATAAATDGMA
jgi:hypothetical protein